ncbi:MAG: glycerophosphoryl diester phosphodiesterase [Rhodospirillaceae bacterium]|nr:glycerophosphoryl diester phosphodiesterase [Rhodospirillaceae bacterium]
MAPENTLASFRRAAADGATWVEFDAALTLDRRVVIFHDDDLDRTSDGSGPLAGTLFEAVNALDAGSWFGPAFKGEMIPTLEEALDAFASLGLGFNMELKTDPGREVELAATALPIALESWSADRPTPLISSFSRQAVAAAQDIAPQWPRGLIFDRLPEDWAELGKTLGLTTLNANHKNLTREQVMEMRGAGYAVMAYTVNETARAETLFGWGVDAIFTDVPGEMLRVF